MSSLREAFRRRLRPPANDPAGAALISYRLYWTGQARRWSAERRRAMLQAVREVRVNPDFEPNTYERRYAVEGLDESRHAGASLVALQDVLTALQGFDAQAPPTQPLGDHHERQHPD